MRHEKRSKGENTIEESWQLDRGGWEDINKQQGNAIELGRQSILETRNKERQTMLVNREKVKI